MSSKMLAINLAGQGHEVLFISHTAPETNLTPNLTVITWPKNRPNSFRSLLWLWKQVKKHGTDIVLAHNAAINAVAFVSLMARIRFRIAYYHSAYEASLMDIPAPALLVWFRRVRKRWVYGRYHRLVCVSRFALADANRWFGVKPSKCTVIHNALSDRGEQLAPKPAARDGLQFFVASRMHAGKNLQPMVLGFLAFAQKSGNPCCLWIAGEGPEAPGIRTLAEKYPDYVRYLGGIAYDLVDGYIQKSHAVVASTKAEAFGMTVLESLMLATPVLANETGGISEIMEHHKHGLFVRGFQPRDWEEGFEAMAALIADEDRYDRCQMACRQRYLELFTGETQLRKLTDLLNQNPAQ